MHIDKITPDLLYDNLSRSTPVNSGAVACLGDVSCDHDPFNWHVFCAKPGLASIAHSELKKQGFRTFNPQLITKVELGKDGKTVRTKKDLFGLYHFVQFRTEDGDWARVHHTYGVRRLLLGTGCQPSTIKPSAMVPLLRNPVMYAPGVMDIEPDPDLVWGTIEVLDGPWARFRGEVQGSEAGRVTVLMTLFGRPSEVEFAVSSVRRV